MPEINRFLFAAPRHHPERDVNIVLTRDAEANFHLEKALLGLGFDSGRSVLNFPQKERRFDLLPFDSLFQVDLPFLVEGSLLCQATRPPLSDGNQSDKKKVEPSNTTLERATFLHWSRYFRRVARSSVILQDAVAALLPDGYHNRQEMKFHQNDGCSYLSLQETGCSASQKKFEDNRTAAFLLRVDSIAPNLPGLVAAWGLNAEATLAWCRTLRYRAPSLLENRGLTMVELYPTVPTNRPMTYGYMDDWKFDVLFEMKGELPPRPEESDFAISF